MSKKKKHKDASGMAGYPDPAYEQATKEIKKHFYMLRLRLMAFLFLGFMVPLGILTVFFYVQFNTSLTNSGKLNLATITERQRKTIDLFLQDRVANLFNVFHSRDFRVNPTNENMDDYFSMLRQASDAFTDIGFLDENGVQNAYSGPFSMLAGKNYCKEEWYKTLMNQKQDYYISEIYMGFRQKAHFTLAVRQIINGKMYVLRSALDPDKFFIFLRTISQGKEIDSTLINKQGRYQVVDPGDADFLGLSDFVPHADIPSDVVEYTSNGKKILVAYSWLAETPWVLLVRQPATVAYAGLQRTRQILFSGMAVIVLTLFVIFFTTRKLVKQAQSIAEKGQSLQHQLIHASNLAAIGELATGVAHEINNPLAIINSTTGVVRDMLNPEFNLNPKPEEILAELAEIDRAVFRAKGITSQLLNLSRKNVPKPEITDIHKLIDEVLGGFKERSFISRGIKIEKQYVSELPTILIDPDPIRQVFLNLLNNAGDAIKGPGTITVTTGIVGEYLTTTIGDTGEGISPENLKKIFDPFFTTKPPGKGTGLGLSISMRILELIGGKIDVHSVLGKGTSFTVSLPLKKEPK